MTEFHPTVCRRPRTATRCPYCHDEVPGGGVRCGGCGAHHHSLCVDEHPSCATCGYDLSDQVHRALLQDAESRDGGWVRWEAPRSWHDEYRRWRRWVWRPMLIGGVGLGAGLAVMLHAAGRWLAS